MVLCAIFPLFFSVPTEVLLSNACTIGDCDEVVRILSFSEPPNVSQKYLYFAAKGGMYTCIISNSVS